MKQSEDKQKENLESFIKCEIPFNRNAFKEALRDIVIEIMYETYQSDHGARNIIMS